MKRLLALVAVMVAAIGLQAEEMLPIETQVAEAVKSPKVTIVHFWATWCPNCRQEFLKDGWSTFINSNPDVNFIFVQARDDKPAVPYLEKYGVGAQKNLTLLQHPNASRKKETQITAFMGIPMTWVPSTWIYREGTLRYALNYGEIHFPMLQQLVRDSADKDQWSHKNDPKEPKEAPAAEASKTQ